MDYWRCPMNWPRDFDWTCEICGSNMLTWGFQHARCRCDMCHTEYHMRDLDTGERVTTPICMLKPEYKAAFKMLWARDGIPIGDVADADWEAAGIREEEE